MSILFVVVVGVAFPLLALRSHRLLERGYPFPPRPMFLAQTLALLVLVGALAAATARIERIDLFPPPGDLALLAIVSVVGLVVTLSVVPLGWRVASERQKERLSRILPETGREWALYVGIAVAAGVGEEMAYRGVLFQLLLRWTDSVSLAVVLAASSFALAHAVQGRAGVAAVAALGLGFHAIVLLTGSLYAAMAVHAGHDLVAGVWYRRLLGRTTPKEPPRNPNGSAEPPSRID